MLRVVLLLRHLAAAEFQGKTYSARQELTTTTTFRDCTFKNCVDEREGGAIYVASGAVSLSLLSCRFANCRTEADCGGALYVNPGGTFTMTATSAVNSTSKSLAGFGWIGANRGIDVQDSSTSFGRAPFTARFWAINKGAATTMTTTNATGNVGEFWGSGAYLDVAFGFKWRYCVYAKNTGANCLHIEHVSTHDIDCLVVFDNQCKTEADYPGLLCVHSILVWHRSVFQGNSYDYFIGSDLFARIDITFVECVFDFKEVKKTNSIILATTGCLYVKEKTALPACSH